MSELGREPVTVKDMIVEYLLQEELKKFAVELDAILAETETDVMLRDAENEMADTESAQTHNKEQ